VIYTQEDPARTGKESLRSQAPEGTGSTSFAAAGSGPNPNTVTNVGSPKEEIRRIPALDTVSTQIPYG
jgi:hypothetical protein